MNHSPIDVDVAVIGAGTAGLNAFNAVKRAGASGVLIDHGPLGTTCARVGCMPSKAVLHAGHRWAAWRALAGAEPPAPALSRDDLWRHARETRDRLVRGAVGQTKSLAGERLLMGHARFVAPDALDVEGRRVTARAFVVATGSQPVVPSFLKALGSRVVTTDTLFDLEALPRRVGILGLGAVGLEMGVALARLGVEVTAGDLLDAPGGITDPQVAARAIETFSPELTMWLGQRLDAQPADGGVSLRGEGRSATVDLLLAALGRRPDLDGLDLERAGVRVDEHGRPPIDRASLRSGDSRVFIAGDANADRPLMHEAVDEGLIAAEHAVALARGGMAPAHRRRTPLAIVFTDPDIATAGVRHRDLDPQRIVVGAAEGAANGRSRVLGAEGNLVRVYADPDSGRLLGAELIATHGEHLGHLVAWAVQCGQTVHDLLHMPYYHPSIEELLQSALKDAARRLPAPADAVAGMAPDTEAA